MIGTGTGETAWETHPAAADARCTRIECPWFRCCSGEQLLVGNQRVSISGPHATSLPTHSVARATVGVSNIL
jgi:hypothetical protein